MVRFNKQLRHFRNVAFCLIANVARRIYLTPFNVMASMLYCIIHIMQVRSTPWIRRKIRRLKIQQQQRKLRVVNERKRLLFFIHIFDSIKWTFQLWTIYIDRLCRKHTNVRTAVQFSLLLSGNMLFFCASLSAHENKLGMSNMTYFWIIWLLLLFHAIKVIKIFRFWLKEIKFKKTKQFLYFDY